MENKISVIIPTRNRRKFLEQAINSIVAQYSVNVEVIIVDDASTDDTKEYVSSINKNDIEIKYFQNEKSMFAHEARRLGYLNATGKYIVFMDDDDFYTDINFFYDALEIFLHDSNVSTVIGSTIEFKNGQYGKKIDLKGNGKINGDDYLNGFNCKYTKPKSTMSAMFKKELLDRVHLSSSKMVNDTCIYLYGISDGDIYLINRPVAAYRVHDTNISKRKFDYAFIKNVLQTKLEIYNMVYEKIKDKEQWLFVQMSQSAYYFILCSGKDLKTVFFIMRWIFLNAKEIRCRIIKDIFYKAFKLRGKGISDEYKK